MSNQDRLLQVTALDAKDEVEEYWLKNRDQVLTLVKLPNPDLIDSETSRLLVQACQQNNPDEILVGTCCIYLLSKDERVSQLWLNCLCNASRDSLQTTTARLADLATRKYHKFSDHVQTKLVRLVGQLAEKNFGVHALINVLLRQIVGGSLSAENIRLADALIEIIIPNRGWLERNQETLQFSTIRYLRLIQDHNGIAGLERLLEKEIKFVITNLRTKFSELIPIGKELVRLLLGVCHIQPFNEFWSDLIHKPQSLQPKFHGVQELLKIRTQTKFVKLNVTFEMANKITFMLQKVKFGQHEYYQRWLIKTYLSSMTSQSLLPDLVRFVVLCVIPTNEILASDVLPRWAFCGFILSQCTTAQTTSATRLSLVWDWLLFNESRNTIMDIEPGLLLMQQSRKTHPQTTYGILDLLLRLVKEFYAPMKDEIQRGIINSFRFCIKVGVVKSIEPILLETQRYQQITPCLYNLIQENLQEFLRPEHRVKIDQAPKPGRPSRRPSDTTEEKFSDDEDSNDVPESKKPKIEAKIEIKNEPIAIVTDKVSRADLQNRYYQIVEQLNKLKRDTINLEIDEEISKIRTIDEDMADTFDKLISFKKEEDEFAHHLDMMLSKVSAFDNGPFDSEICEPVATCIYRLCYSSYDPLRMPTEKPREDELDELLSRPLYILFRQIVDHCERPAELDNLMDLMVSLQQMDNRTLHHFLFYIFGHELQNKADGWHLFPNFCKRFSEMESMEALEIQLPLAIQSLIEHERAFLFRILPKLYKEHTKLLVNHHEITRLVMSAITPKDLQFLQTKLIMRDFTMFKTNTANHENDFKLMLIESLCWESFEQQALWTLIFAQEVKPETWAQIIPYLNEEIHFEAVTAIAGYFYNRQEDVPPEDVLKFLFAAEKSQWITALMMVFCHSKDKRKDFFEVFGLITLQTIKKSDSKQSSRRKRQLESTRKDEPSLIGILKHMNNMRITVERSSSSGSKRLKKASNDVRTMFSNDYFLSGLIAAKENSSLLEENDNNEEDFSDLWKLIDGMTSTSSEEDDKEKLPSKKDRKESGKKQKGRNKRVSSIEISDDSDDQDETPPKKKRT